MQVEMFLLLREVAACFQGSTHCNFQVGCEIQLSCN